MPCERVDGRTDGGWGFHTPPSSHPHPSMRRIQRPGTRPQAGDYLSLSFFFLLFVGSAASPTFLPFHHPPTPSLVSPPKKRRNPLSFSSSSPPPFSIHSSTPDAVGRGQSSKRRRAPPRLPSLPRPRSTPIGADCSRGTPIEARAARCFRTFLAACFLLFMAFFVLLPAWRRVRVGRPVGG